MCRDIGIQTAQPWARLGDMGAAIQACGKNRYSGKYATSAETWLRRQDSRKNRMWNTSAKTWYEAC